LNRCPGRIEKVWHGRKGEKKSINGGAPKKSKGRRGMTLTGKKTGRNQKGAEGGNTGRKMAERRKRDAQRNWRGQKTGKGGENR